LKRVQTSLSNPQREQEIRSQIEQSLRDLGKKEKSNGAGCP
jgi:hypothetical protein